jgi:hypothetical protein
MRFDGTVLETSSEPLASAGLVRESSNLAPWARLPRVLMLSQYFYFRNPLIIKKVSLFDFPVLPIEEGRFGILCDILCFREKPGHGDLSVDRRPKDPT